MADTIVQALNEGPTVTTRHPAYEAMANVWQRCRDVYAGSDEVKARGEAYLPKVSPKMSENAYNAYLLRALFYPVMQKTVYGVAGTVLGKPGVINWTTEAQQARYEKDLANVDGTGATWERFLFASLRDEVLVTGRHVWALDFSKSLNRPVWRSYPAESVTFWRTERIDDADVLTMIVILECEELSERAGKAPVFGVAERDVYRVLWLDRSGETPMARTCCYVKTTHRVAGRTKDEPTRDEDRWEVDPKSERVITKYGAPLTFLPVLVVGALGVTSETTEPPFRDLADVNLSHYRSFADLEWGRHFTALPTPWVVGVPASTSEMEIGSGSAWILDPGGEAGMLEYTGQGLGALVTACEDKEAKMAALGARPFETARAGVETAEAIRLRQAADIVTLDTLSRALSEAATIMLSWSLWWRGDASVKIAPNGLVTEGVAVELSREFADVALASDELRAWVETYQNGGISFETFYERLVAAKLARPGISADNERAAIRAADKDEDLPPAIVPVDGNKDGENGADDDSDEDDDPPADGAAD